MADERASVSRSLGAGIRPTARTDGDRSEGGLRRLLGEQSALDERLPEHLDVLCGERLGLEHLELRDPSEDAERGLEIGILEDAEILPRAHDCEEALDSTSLV